MKNRTFIVAGELPMWDRSGNRVDPGGEITLPDDDATRLNVAAGTLELRKRDAEPARMTCPICAEHMKRPTKVESVDELERHYADKHAGFAVPDWEDDL